MDTGIQNILGKLSLEDVEKLRILFSMVPQAEQKEVVTLRVFIDEYCNLIKQNRSIAYYNSVVHSLKQLTDFFSQRDGTPGLQKSIQSIGLRDIENFITYLQQKAKKGYRVYFKTLKAAFNKACDWGYVKENFFNKVKLPKKQKVNPAFIDERQLVLICKKIDVEIVKEISILGFYTGMRLNELINMTWRNVNLTTRIITVGDENFTTKGKNQRYIPISDEAFEILTRRIPKVHIVRNDRSYVFCKLNGLPFTGDFISKRFKRACKAAEIDKAIHFHSLRHSFASSLAQKGISLYIIKELLGHSSISTTEIYSHLNMDSLKDAIKTFDTSASLSAGSLTSRGTGLLREKCLQKEFRNEV